MGIKLNEKKNYLFDDDKVVIADTGFVKIFKSPFYNIIKSLHIKCPFKFDFDSDSVVNAIKNFLQHPGLIKIKLITSSYNSFFFQEVSKEDILYHINLDLSKATQKYINIFRVTFCKF